MNQALTLLEDDDAFDQANVYIEPPQVNEDTDEDSGDDEAHQATTANLNRNQLLASASVTIMRHGIRTRLGDPEQDDQLVSKDFQFTLKKT